MFQLIIAILIAFAPPIAPQNYGSIEGTVIDKVSSETLPFAAITLLQKGKVVFWAESDFLNGFYSIDSIPAGVYELHCHYIGIPPKVLKNITIMPQQTAKYDVVLFDKTSIEVDLEQKIKSLPARTENIKTRAEKDDGAFLNYEPTGDIKGKVLDDSTRETLSFSDITLLKGEKVIASTESDFEGNYELNNIPAGTYDVYGTNEYLDYVPLTIKGVVVPAGRTVDLDLLCSAGTSKQTEIREYIPPAEPSTSGGVTLGEADIASMTPFLNRAIRAITHNPAKMQKQQKRKKANK